jgi:hypothetical protein
MKLAERRRSSTLSVDSTTAALQVLLDDDSKLQLDTMSTWNYEEAALNGQFVLHEESIIASPNEETTTATAPFDGEPSEFDVLLGRGKSNTHHPGNQAFQGTLSSI